jgi:precorrin-6B methylase 2
MKMHKHIGLVGIAAVFMTFSAVAATKYTGEGGVELDVPYVPTPQELVDRMLKLANVGPDDIHYDLGSGDGRIVVTAARDMKVKKGVGVDLDPVRIAEANENAKKAGVTDRVTFKQADLFQMDFSEASVMTMYLLPEVNLKLRPKILDEMKPGSRIVTHAFTMGDWQPDKHEVVDSRNIYLFIVPAKVAGTWTWQVGNETYKVDLKQQYQMASGNLTLPNGKQVPIESPVLAGANITFAATVPGAAAPLRFSGKVSGNSIEGAMDVAGKSTKVTAKKSS